MNDDPTANDFGWEFDNDVVAKFKRCILTRYGISFHGEQFHDPIVTETLLSSSFHIPRVRKTRGPPLSLAVEIVFIRRRDEGGRMQLDRRGIFVANPCSRDLLYMRNQLDRTNELGSPSGNLGLKKPYAEEEEFFDSSLHTGTEPGLVRGGRHAR